MQKTKAAFKALREGCGLSQQDVADEAGVSLLSVKHWENPKYPNMPKEDVWEFLLACHAAMFADAQNIADKIAESLASTKGARDLRIDYCRDQSMLDEIQRGTGTDEPVGYYNARMRLVGHLLDCADISYTFDYPNRPKA